jgi:hypothetical protein
MTDSESHSSRINELAITLADALVRALERKSSRILLEDPKTPLDCGPERGGDVHRKSEDIVP